MAWTTPRDWTGISDSIVTAAQLNVDVRDNLLFLGGTSDVTSGHTHTGAAGMGAASMSGLTLTALGSMTFSDTENPDAAGEVRRNGNDLLFYGSSLVNLTAADASAGTASLRTLGTTSVKAAAGNHTHTISSAASGSGDSLATVTGSETDIVTHSATPGAAVNSWAVFGAVHIRVYASEYTLKLYYDATVLQTLTGVTGSPAALIVGMSGLVEETAASSHTIKITGQVTSGSNAIVDGVVSFREVEV